MDHVFKLMFESEKQLSCTQVLWRGSIVYEKGGGGQSDPKNLEKKHKKKIKNPFKKTIYVFYFNLNFLIFIPIFTYSPKSGGGGSMIIQFFLYY